ncbi:hypothetical protein I2486_15805 [Cellulophaga sp. E16_2]|uniref:Uncharacterized protein n=1 Tax=Cellulophaga algicola (strain DSM 14237 / IC166 / ACAM 630) TaxID=688270 RepID=E6X4X6_CELAD|nr:MULTISPECIES: hypothetical protein [Cellulophaga]ADV50468.1 hypothetical protein Celal_3196 [Cellulophaga algicola DSM 14237]MBO0592870.1 hypothetical protein [Cellulophaga sp. E16_2]
MRIIIALIILTASNITVKSDLTKENLKGKVRSVLYYSNENPTNYSSISNYNEEGNLIETIYFDCKNAEWVESRRLIKKYKYYKNNSIKMIEHLDYYDYDSKYLGGRLVEKYNKQGELVNEIDYQTFYNKEENRPYNPYKDIYTNDTVVYNKKLNQKTTYRHHSDGTLMHYWIEKFDYKENPIESKLYNYNDSLFIEHSYNSKGLEKTLIVYGNHKKDTLHKYISTYDNLSNKIKYSKHETRKKEITIYNYEYKLDKNKNWIFLEKLQEGIIIDTTRRKIVYYKKN